VNTPTRLSSLRDPKNLRAAGVLVDLRGRRRILLAIGALTFLALLIAWAKAAERPPSPAPAFAPKTQFSAERAWGHLDRIASEEPTPIGSAGGDEVRDYLERVMNSIRNGLEMRETEIARGPS
jgi:hypothetical protein